MAIIEVTEFVNENEPALRKPTKSFSSLFTVMEEYGLTLEEATDAMKNKTAAKGRILIDLAPMFVQNLANDEDFEDYKGSAVKDAVIDALREAAVNEALADMLCGYTRKQIREFLGLTDGALRQTLCRAINKLTEFGTLQKLLRDLGELGRLRSRRGLSEGMQIVRKTKIRISVE